MIASTVCVQKTVQETKLRDVTETFPSWFFYHHTESQMNWYPIYLLTYIPGVLQENIYD